MGRIAMFIVLAAVAAGGSALIGTQEARTRKTDRLASAYEQSMAQQAARSGFAIAERQLADAPEVEFDESGVALDGGALGSYDARADDDGTDMVLTVTGHFGDASHTFSASYDDTPIPSVMMMQALSVDWSGDPEEIRVSGSPRRPPSIALADWDASAFEAIGGVATATPALATVLESNMTNRQRNKVDGAPDFGVAAMPTWVQEAVDEAPSVPGAVVQSSGQYNRIGSVQDGSPANPFVVVAREGARFEDNFRGYGVLIVTGDCTFIDDARWEGLVIMLDTPSVETKLHLEDNAKIFGAVALNGVDEMTGAPTGAFRVRMIDNAKIFWSGDTIERLAGTLPALDDLFSTKRTLLGPAGV